MNVTRARAYGTVTRLVVLCGLSVGLSVVGCAPRPLALPGRDPREPPGSPPLDNEARLPNSEVASKPVAGKEPPATLIAEDGSRCVVPERKYREAHIGEHVICAWRSGRRTP